VKALVEDVGGGQAVNAASAEPLREEKEEEEDENGTGMRTKKNISISRGEIKTNSGSKLGAAGPGGERSLRVRTRYTGRRLKNNGVGRRMKIRRVCEGAYE